MWREGKRE
ncbi:hypothetical protein E2C01_084861 [Portunus trituberculatus]|uniref:Uncharacterized protein n=1 Tax=Portunus trituberculatus TaxID=210409 RepID=A0A5B7JAE3_PORTR|nr:hypothetical protein [Portunus trituberculatus]